MNFFKKSRVLAGGALLLLLVLAVGCVGKQENFTLQGIFTKNGIVLQGVGEGANHEVYLKMNEPNKKIPERMLGKNTIMVPGNWDAGVSYQLAVDGKSWTAIAPAKPQAWISGVAPIGQLEELPTINEWSVVVNESVAVSYDGQYVAVASFDHSVYVFDRSGNKLWEYRIPSGIPVSVVFSTDASMVFVGESSPDGTLYAFDRATGKIVWQYAFSELVGSGTSMQWSNRPNVRSLTVSGDKIIAGGQYRKRFVEKQGERSVILYPTSSVVVAFDGKTGQKRWQYPAEGTMDTGVSKIVVSANGEKIVFANQSWSPAEQYPDGGIRVLNGQTGRLAASFQASVQKPFFSWVGIHEGIDLSSNGKYLAIFASDNQAMLFDLSNMNLEATNQKIEPLWTKLISKVHSVGGVPVYASGSVARVTNDGTLFFMTSQTFSADKNVSATPPFSHPEATTLFAYSPAGELLWRWQTEGGVGKVKFSADSRFMIAAIYHNYINQSKEQAGLYCFDLQAKGQDYLSWFYPVEGVTTTGDIAADGTTIVGCEIPIRNKEGILSGEHRLHILQ